MDVEHQISQVRRHVGSRTLEAGEARVVTIGRAYPVDLTELWDACTNPERIPRWFLPISGELRLGGRYQLEGNAGGTIERCDPPHGFAATWEFAGEVSWIEVSLTEESPGSTRLELVHIAHVDDERWAQFGPGAVGIGWDMGLMGLAEYLGPGEPAVDPGRAAVWLASVEGLRFLTMASEEWYRASVAAGTDETAARAATDRVTAAYTGAPEPSTGG